MISTNKNQLYVLCKTPPSVRNWVRFFNKVTVLDWMQCWNWQGGLFSNGYGRFSQPPKQALAHRVMFGWVCGALSSQLVIDHLCRNRSCVNPLHLRLVTQKENLLAGRSPAAALSKRSHCTKGHPFTEDNTKHFKGERGRTCRTCHNEKSRLIRAKRKLDGN